ncbi:uncharacterized protein SAPINGB_P005941 [Magnusiomyces paraingens]|uniref:AAA+ ATPase domain-containing protein n=1 Tax=Magnusiomyces paraingens TaxID=2606893 RepID=A0A5E8C7M4_9ASCO|nr:uncharacterized protein SAPINGB_P005941 [Saprochaete ingens]VVT57908.1 unnamed protein product [Saprochaete ingens]
MAKKVNLNAPAKKSATSSSPSASAPTTSGSAFGSSPFGGSAFGTTTTTPPPPPSSAQPASQKPTKPPKELILRPSVSAGNSAAAAESLVSLYAHPDTLRAYGIASGDLMVVSKPDHPGLVLIAAQTPQSSPKEVVKMAHETRQILGLVLGDRIEIKKYHLARPETALSVTIGIEQDPSEFQLQDQVSQVLTAAGIVMPGLSFTIDSEKYTILDCQTLPDIASLSVSDGAEKDDNDDLVTPVFLFNNKSTLEFTNKTMTPYNVQLPVLPSFKDIGGMSKQIALLQSKIKLPLNHPNLFERFNNTSPETGFLLHGPSGTGKSMLLNAIAHEMNSHVLTINGPSIVSKYLGETEAALRQVFAEARRYQPALIFIDEIDALVPRRGSDDAGEAESRVVSTLLTLMDSNHRGGKAGGSSSGSSSSNRVIVIGATNRPNSIDPALRRAGRFGQEIEIGIPDAQDRVEILQLMLHGMPHKLSEEQVVELAATKMHGYVGADISALVGQCVSLAIDRGLAQDLPPEEMYITSEDAARALLEVRPSAMREIVLETPKVYWTDIGGQEEVKQKLKETVDWPLSHPETFKRLGVHQPKGILLYGPPGCSKTLTAKALATEAGLNFLAVKGPEIFNKYVGESERAVRDVFRKARAAAPSIIFFDEIDALSASREDGGGGGSSDRVLTSLLNEMDGIETLVGVTVLAATNRPDVIDAALMRPGRLDRLIYVGPPDFEARKKILEIQFKKMAVGEDVKIDELAEATQGCSGAEIVQFCQEAGLLAMNEDLDIKCIYDRHMQEALAGIKRGITKEMIEFYENYNREGKA